MDWRIQPIPPGTPEARPGIKPPHDGDVERGWKWSEWVRERERFSLPGWTYCRFPIQYPNDLAVFVFGIARGSFGIYPRPATVRDIETGQDAEQILCSIVHMRTGCGMALFADPRIAAQACDLAEKVETRWAEIDPGEPATWRQADHRLKSAWHSIGIVPAVNAFAHHGDGGGWSIFGLSTETLMSGRPDHLS